MEDKIEFTVRDAMASLDGDTARIALVTDQGRVTLRMHRLDLGALGGTIARALWPKAGESVPTQRELHETEAEPSAAIADAEPHSVPTQPELHDPDAEPSAATADAEPHSVPTQPELHDPEAEPSAAIADAEPQTVPTQPELHESEAEPSVASADAEPRSPA
jgi:hypothetical protein